MGIGTIVTIILGSSFLGALLTNLVSWGLRRAERKREANYLSLNLAHVFEGFAYSCLSMAEDHDNAESSGGQIGGYVRRPPKFPGLPESDYRSLNLGLLDDVFDFPQRVHFANESLDSAFDVLDGEDAVREGYITCLQLANESLRLGDLIRERYRLKYRELTFGTYSVRDRLRKKSNTIGV